MASKSVRLRFMRQKSVLAGSAAVARASALRDSPAASGSLAIR